MSLKETKAPGAGQQQPSEYLIKVLPAPICLISIMFMAIYYILYLKALKLYWLMKKKIKKENF